ncbi:MAG: agmatinase [Gemmataceae bacterium]
MTTKPSIVSLLGIPYDETSSFLRGPALAPSRIREALHCGSSNWCAEVGLDLSTTSRWSDQGDITVGVAEVAREQIEIAVTTQLQKNAHVFSLGGDHSITYPILRAYAKRYTELSVLQIDAHPDLYAEYDGNPYSHACSFARIMEERLATRLVQMGIRGTNPHQREQAERFGVEVIEMRQWNPQSIPRFDGPVYLSLDLDGVDPAFAPGVSHPEPGGFTSREVVSLIQGLSGSLVGADVVELNPHKDSLGITAMLAAKLVKELLAKMLSGS